MAYQRKHTDAAEQYLGADRTIELGDVGVGQGDIEVIDRVLPADKLETERFMSQKIDVVLHDSSDENDDDFVQVQVNGKTQMFLRGITQTVRRFYVEALARSKRTTYKQNLDDRLGEAGVNALRARNSLNYPFSVVHDPDPRGRAWLQQVLAQRT
jgi:hypothetical protein